MAEKAPPETQLFGRVGNLGYDVAVPEDDENGPMSCGLLRPEAEVAVVDVCERRVPTRHSLAERRAG